MHCSPLRLIVAFAAAAAAQQASGSNPNPFKIPPSGLTLTAGQPATVSWTPTTQGSVTLTLREGASSDLNKGTVIASSIANSGSATFTLPSDTVRNSDYTLEISSDSDASQVNYTPQFVVESKNTVAPISSGASSATSAASTMSAMSSASTASVSSKMSSSSSTASKTSSSTSSATGSSSSTAPSGGAGNVLKAQGGLAALIMGAVIAI